jgi:hypothetical protein
MRTSSSERSLGSRFVRACLLSAILAAGPAVAAGRPSLATQVAAAAPMLFATPEQAAHALVDAAAAYNVPQLLAIFGPNGKDLVESADPVRDKANAQAFAAEARTKLTISTDPKKPGRAIIVVGAQQWPMPVPLVEKNGKWSFDAREGRQEILYRRIGANELDAIQVCRGYVEAQRQYSLQIHDNSGVNQYAQRIFSTPGKQDGLYWANPDGSPGGPIGKAVGDALAEGYSIGKRGFHGYYFKILKGQGPAAPLGRLNYVIEGIMIGGFALVAVPAQYRVTGVKTFQVSNSGIVYQKDLGPNSLSIVNTMELYNPDSSWQPTYDHWPES